MKLKSPQLTLPCSFAPLPVPSAHRSRWLAALKTPPAPARPKDENGWARRLLFDSMGKPKVLNAEAMLGVLMVTWSTEDPTTRGPCPIDLP